ncbi:PepSY domain-containing protein [Shewanella sp. NKUCC01_JLK]|uniref:PepSY-associated TM helix domain-containing protein n=1 Tax=Shewanella sp. NKUCC01_JLK TaxID=2842123 RepID=UPI001C5BB77F|nr:PepSY-associated TM helix domain-containing protein [Shewanella sp. NKUCC01_JLK]MBW3517181.1 PepSY domain-containing protein [Shewanella sp. NKUCC01_JLK]
MLRKWHIWLGVILLLPIAIVALTAVFIAHDKLLGLKQITLGIPVTEPAEIKTLLPLQADIWLAAGKFGIARQQLKEGMVSPSVMELAGVDIRQLLAVQDNILAAGNQGIYLRQGETWSQTLKADIHQLSADGLAILAVAKDNQLYRSEDYQTWQKITLPIAVESLHGETQYYTASKLVMDLHTGKAIFGKAGEWIWIDVIGLAIFFLTFSGVILWWRRRQLAHG